MIYRLAAIWYTAFAVWYILALLEYDIISVPHTPQAYIIARSAISYRRYITRSDRNGYHCKKQINKFIFRHIHDLNFIISQSRKRVNDISLTRYDIRLTPYDIPRCARHDIISVPSCPAGHIIARSAISYRRYIIRSARNGYHWKIDKFLSKLVDFSWSECS